MNKGTFIRAGIVLSLFIIVLVTFWIIGTVKDTNNTPVLTDSETAYLTVGDFSVTKQELWDHIRKTEGLTYLEQYIEENYLLTTELSEVTQDEIDALVEYYTYGTNDADDIATIKEDPELEQDLIEAYENSLKILGYDPTNAADVKEFMSLEIARTNYAYDAVLAADEDSDLYITEYTLYQYYQNNYKPDVCALNVVFNSANEATAVFNKFNLVPNYNQGWGLYDPSLNDDTPIDELDTEDFTEDNTTELDDEQVFEQFVLLYNYTNVTDEDIDTNDTTATFCANNPDFTYNYLDMNEDRLSSDAYVTLADYIFDTLGTDEDNLEARYSFTLQSVGEFELLSYVVSEEEGKPFYIDNPDYDEDEAESNDEYDVPEEIVNLTDAELTNLRVELLEAEIENSQTKAQLIQDARAILWEDAEYELFDPILKVKYLESYGEAFDNKGSKEYIATFGDVNITADTLYEYVAEKLGTYYSIDLLKNKVVLSSQAYTDLYGDDRDYVNSDLEDFADFRDEIRNMKNAFNNGDYATYGYSPTTYTWEEFMLVAFFATDEAEAIENFYIIDTVNPYFAVEEIDYSAAKDLIEQEIAEYFSLNVVHVLVYLDLDNDLNPDEYNDFVDGLSGDDLVEYESLKTGLENLIESKINDEYDFDEIVKEFNDTLVDDPENDWAEYKAYGFRILTQDLSGNGSLTHENTDGYDEDFVVAVKDLYEDYLVINNASVEDLDELYYDSLFQSNFGLHYLYSTPGTSFDKPTAVYTETDDQQGIYPEDANHDELIPSQEQVDLYIAIKFAEMTETATDAILPTSVNAAIAEYFGDTFNAYFSSGGYTIAAINYILANNPEFASDTAGNVAYLNEVLDILYTNSFEEGYIIPE